MNRPVIPPALRDHQVKASDPALSIWVSANAGSGKTHVLTQRVIRLLLGGVAPAKILCLTFTKAAAAQMFERVFKTLSDWTLMDDAKLREAILATGAPRPSAADLLLARRLFTRTVETPGGLKIQTIHAFCERLLHLFPFEANVPARFEVADELRMQEMLATAKHEAVDRVQRTPGPPSEALALVADLVGIHKVDGLIGQAMARRAEARRSERDLQHTLAKRLGAHFACSEDARAAMITGGLSTERWLAIAGVLQNGSKTDGEQAQRLRIAFSADREKQVTPSADAAANLLAFFFTKDGRGEAKSALLTKALARAHPDIERDLDAERLRFEDLRAQLRTIEAIERTAALVLLVDAVRDRYDHMKIVNGLLDFDDLIERTVTLLQTAGSRWVLHKLDAGIDHLLVDEAQDTSEGQWKILEALTDEFAAGAGARPQHRSFFVVGDEKQSIFSFQGAAPLMFDTMRGRFERQFLSGGRAFERVALKTSFRSVPGILAAVDTVFEAAANQDGLVQPHDVWPLHESTKTRLPGLVEIWPRLCASEPPEPGDWAIPLDMPGERDPPSILADRVARKIKALIAPLSGECVHDGRGERRRPIKAGDILVLVRTRNAFFEAVIRALKHHHVPVAGADRLDVANHIAVMDLAAAGRTALLPQDDLSLACLLKSPLFGLTDDDLIALAPSRKGALFAALGASAQARHRDAHARILAWSRRAGGVTPFAFYLELLGRDGGRKAMESRLGPEAHDAIDEFLRLALAHEQTGAPSLHRFLREIAALESSIKRDMEGPGDAVRVMTVHAAKGLEAKVVFLPDTCAVPAPAHDPVVFDLNKDTGSPPLLVWSPRKREDPPAVAAARALERQAAMREYRRLLYVAMTRAEERLYVAGFYNAKAPPDDCWNMMIGRALQDAEGVEAVPPPWDPNDEPILRIVTPGSVSDAPAEKPRREQAVLGLAPGWLSQPLPSAPRVAPLRPSKLASERAAGVERRRAIAYGSAVHQLLQYLPSTPAKRRPEAGRAFLSAREATFFGIDREAALAEALATMALPNLAPLFSAEARAEVAIGGRLQRADGSWQDVSGTVDRLAACEDGVLVADFKTGSRRDPTRYIGQLALYRAVLAPLWPGRAIRALLVWTQDRSVQVLDPAALDAACAALLASA